MNRIPMDFYTSDWQYLNYYLRICDRYCISHERYTWSYMWAHSDVRARINPMILMRYQNDTYYNCPIFDPNITVLQVIVSCFEAIDTSYINSNPNALDDHRMRHQRASDRSQNTNRIIIEEASSVASDNSIFDVVSTPDGYANRLRAGASQTSVDRAPAIPIAQLGVAEEDEDDVDDVDDYDVSPGMDQNNNLRNHLMITEAEEVDDSDGDGIDSSDSGGSRLQNVGPRVMRENNTNASNVIRSTTINRVVDPVVSNRPIVIRSVSNSPIVIDNTGDGNGVDVSASPIIVLSPDQPGAFGSSISNQVRGVDVGPTITNRTRVNNGRTTKNRTLMDYFGPKKTTGGTMFRPPPPISK
jgi:hypothetical protein